MKDTSTHTITIQTYSDLQQFGINLLTGEACALGLRVLCDLSEEGRNLVADYFGITVEGFRANWNSTVGDAPAVTSIMLTRGALADIALYALFTVAKVDVVVQRTNRLHNIQITGLRTESPYFSHWVAEADQHPDVYILHRNPHAPSTRNTHAMSGRSL